METGDEDRAEDRKPSDAFGGPHYGYARSLHGCNARMKAGEVVSKYEYFPEREQSSTPYLRDIH